ncbi:MAG: RNase P subunit p30 family protein [Candidatus Woesearchaeota archaeon]
MVKQNVIITETNFNKLKQKVKKTKEENKNSRVIFSSEDDELNRKVIEKISEVEILMIPLSEKKDFMKQRNSGFNHVMAKAAKKNNVSIGIDFNEILDAGNVNEKSKILSRVMQNIFLCNKNKIKMVFISRKYSRELRDLKSLGLVLGMPTWMAKQLEFVKLEN